MKSKLNAFRLPFRKNYQEINLKNINQKIYNQQISKTNNIKKAEIKNQQRIGKIEFKNSIIENASFLISNMLLDYVKAGGSIEQLTKEKKKDFGTLSPEFYDTKKDCNLCWTSQKECDMYVVGQSKKENKQ